jgi:tetratricopeptide (TPR) repeat protein
LGCPDEATILAFFEGRLAPARIAEIEGHLGTCTPCVELVVAAGAVLGRDSQLAGGASAAASAAAAPGAHTPFARGASVGRYVVLALVGRGGMGDVYAAYDPELDRKVALKLLHESGASTESRARSQGRLLKEAKAIARLSDPNIVVVHDAGTFGDRVFVAMEFVEGTTLSGWLGGKPRSWSEIRAVFLAAGRGLAAAHAAQIVHRDFKPQNVMVAADGKVRVMDFGLASETGEGDLVRESAPEHADFARTAAFALTRTGTLLGTPAYMAPEQFLGQRADARSDQFAFCVALYEALHGTRPFDGNSLSELAESVKGGRLRDPPQRGRPPAWLRKILMRGLSVDRNRRFPSMQALLAELGRDPERGRRLASIGIGLAALLLVGGALAQRTLGRTGAALCAGARDKLAGVWEPPGDAHPGQRRNATRAAFIATGVGHAGDTWERAAAILDGYARRWAAMYSDSCEATHVRGEQSPEVLDLRTGCLNDNREHLRALTDVLASADPVVVGQAIDAANALPDLARCGDVAALRAVVSPPLDPAIRAKVDDIRRRAADARAQGEAAGRYKQALAFAEPLLTEARVLAYEPAVAEVLALLGWLNAVLEDNRAAVERYEQALWAAEATRDDVVAAEAAVQLIALNGYYLDRSDEGERWAQLADAILRRMGPGNGRLRSWFSHNRGLSRMQAGDLKAAEPDFRAAITLKQNVEGRDHPDVALSLNSLADLHARQGDLAAAIEETDRARAILDRTHGPGSLMSARGFMNRCEYLNGLGRHAEALESCQTAFPTVEATLGPNHAWVGHTLTSMGNALVGLGRAKDALPALRRALDIREHESRLELQAEARFALARALWQTGDHAAGRAAAETARAEYAKVAKAKRERDTIDAWLVAHVVRPEQARR